MIVRISTEGQYEVGDEHAHELNKLDNQAVAACEAADEAEFRQTFGRLLELVRANGRPVSNDDLVASDLILPPPDVSLEEATREFSGEGLIPG